MNKLYRIVSSTLMGVLLLLGMNSCTQERLVTPDAESESRAGQLLFKLGNDALRSVPAEAFEKEVDPNSVWCVFLTNSGSSSSLKVVKQAKRTLSGEYMVDAGFEGAAHMFVIGNVDSDLQSQLCHLPTGAPLQEVQQLLVRNGLGNGTADPEMFVMTSDLQPVTLPAKGAAPTNISTPIVLKRLAARFDVINEVPGLKLTTVTVANRYIISSLLDGDLRFFGANKIAGSTDYTITDGKVLLHKIYSYQNSHKGNEADAISFTLRGQYNGKEVNPIKVLLEDEATGQAIDVRRNYCYRIILKPTGDDDKPINPDPSHPNEPTPAWKVTIKVLDWNEAATDLANYSDEDLNNQGDVPGQTINPSGVNLLGAVAEYNLDVSGTQFVTTHSNKAGISGYFNWAEAMALKMPAGYHLPTREEWLAILGSEWEYQAYTYFNKNDRKTEVSLMVQIPGHQGTIACKQDIKQVRAESATYMIRYKDNDTYRSAWRYSYVNSPITGEGKILKIESVPIKANLTIDKLNKDYFAKPEVRTYVKTIYFPATGWGYSQNGSGTSGEFRGIDSGWWSATSYDSNYAYSAYFAEDTGTGVNRDYKTGRRFAVRLFQGI